MYICGEAIFMNHVVCLHKGILKKCP